MPQMYCSLRGLLYSPYSLPRVWTFPRSPTDAPTSPTTREILVAKGGTTWARINQKFCLRLRLPRQFRDLLHAANLRNVTHGFTSLPKEGVLSIFSPWKILTASAGFEPANLDLSFILCLGENTESWNATAIWVIHLILFIQIQLFPVSLIS
jgi:hypothetical protein